MGEKLLDQSIAFFKSNKGFKRPLTEVMKKYKSLGYIGGTIILDKLTPEEQDALSGFFRSNYYKSKANIRVEAFQKALDTTKFKGVDFLEVLKGYFGDSLISNKEAKEIYEINKREFYNEILRDIGETRAYQWLSDLMEAKDNAYRIINGRYDLDRESLRRDILTVAKGLDNLPLWEDTKIRLAIFASNIANNPHYFDQNTEGGKLFIYGISYLLNSPYPQNAEETLELLYRAGIVKDEISNFTMCSGLVAYWDENPHPGWQGFLKSHEPIQISLYNLSKLSTIKSSINKVFVFENPTVFIEIFEATKDIMPPLVCTYGQVKVASLVLLDMLCKEGFKIYYSGDFDPEGLIIADKLKQRYGDSLVLWRYTVDNYISSLSKEMLEDSRIKKLDKLHDEHLKQLAMAMVEEAKAAYQETIVEQLIQDIRDYIK